MSSSYLGYTCILAIPQLIIKKLRFDFGQQDYRLKIRGALVVVNQINVAKENLIGAAFVGIWCTAANSSCYSILVHYLLLLII